MDIELYKKYRPQKLSDVVGQRDAVESLVDMGKRKALPHTLLLVGPSGCGKTSIARILRKKIKCSDRDFAEINSADFRGIDTVREIRKRMGLAPIDGKCRVWLIDEVHAITGQAQDALLKILEDTPGHVYFMLATTDPEKLKKTIRTRCTEIACKALTHRELSGLARDIAAKESHKLDDDVADKIADAAEGSARKALVLLHAVIGLNDTEAQLAAVANAEAQNVSGNLAKMLLNPRSSWAEVAAYLKEVKDEPERIRWGVLGYCRTVLLGGKKMAARAAAIIEEFRDPFYESKAAGLAASCYSLIVGEE